MKYDVQFRRGAVTVILMESLKLPEDHQAFVGSIAAQPNQERLGRLGVLMRQFLNEFVDPQLSEKG